MPSGDLLIAVDPGTKVVAWAAYQVGRLARCGLERGDTPAALGDRLEERFAVAWPPGARVVIEWPQVYQQRRWRGDPNDLIAVAAVAGAVRHLCRAAAVMEVQPHAWKGAVPKRVMLDRITQRLDAEERGQVEKITPASLRHNAIDAAGLGLWALGRL